MGSSASTDIFKFISLRTPENFDYEKEVVTIIRDGRMYDKYSPFQSHNINEDQTKFIKSAVAKAVLNCIQTRLDSIATLKEVISKNIEIAEEVKSKFGINESTAFDEVVDFVKVIRRHVLDFNKIILLADLDVVIKKHFPNLTGILDYVEIIADGDKSRFCYAFENLFDRLYVLYICKRKYPVNLEYVIDGLKALHVIRFLALDIKRQREMLSESVGCLYAAISLLRGIKQPKALAGNNLGKLPQVGKEPENPRTDCAYQNIVKVGDIPQVTIKTKGDFARVLGANPYIHPIFAYLIGYYKRFKDIRPVGVGDLLVVKQSLRKYEAGEVAHVENVLKGESKERSHRRLDRTEDFFSTQTDKSEETEKELQTTERFELKAEAENTMKDDLNAHAEANVHGTYGTVEYTVSGGIAYNTSKSDSQRSSSNFAKDIVNRSLSKVQNRVREERTTKKVSEIEEINRHGINNTSGSGHVSGIYRWLDKRYKAQVYNYGKRLMFEFVIPEPAAFIKSVVEKQKLNTKKPDTLGVVEPKKPEIDPANITQSDVSKYNLDPMLPKETVVVVPCVFENATASNVAKNYTGNIPEGYEVYKVYITGFGIGNTASRIYICIGQQSDLVKKRDEQAWWGEGLDWDPTSGTFRDQLHVGIFAKEAQAFSITVKATARITDEKRAEWRKRAYEKIMSDYEKELAAYKSALSDYEATKNSYDAIQSAIAKGYNPKLNSEIIMTELKKHCLTMITKQFAENAYKAEDIDFNVMGYKTTQDKQSETVFIPAIKVDDALQTGVLIQFLEQAFEWYNISYILYPYFWGRIPDTWYEIQQYYDEKDQNYAKFLQAGSARVLVPVRPAYETAVMHYLYTHEPWNGGPVPGIYDPLYVPIHTELKNQQDDLNNAVPWGDPWEVVVPTSLVYLQSSSDLPTYDSSTST